MSLRRSRKGAVLGLVVATALILVILGIGLLLMIMQLGGGQELQHATDAGNLNVAKQVLRHPGVSLASGDEVNQFGDEDDPDTGEVNLLTFNQLVAHAYLVNANAHVLGTTDALTHAGNIMDTVEQISQRLNNELINSSNFDGHFGNVATNHAMRMFEASSNPVSHLGTEHAVSLMARGNATNVYLNDMQILLGGTSIASNTVVGPNGNRFLKGYFQLASQDGETLWGVPLRPGLPPHLVSQKNFNENSVRDPIPGFVPPNSFKSAGLAQDRKTSANLTRAISMSLVGSLDTQYAGDIRRGVIVVDNTGALEGQVFPHGFDIWQDKLMSPNYVEVLGNNAGSGLVADQNGGSPTLESIQNWVNVPANYDGLAAGNAATQNAFATMLGGAGVNSYGSFSGTPAALAQNMTFVDFVKNSTLTKCTNGSADHDQGAPPLTTAAGSGDQPCNLEKFVELFNQPGTPGTPSGTTVGNLMAVERYHLDICKTRASGAECADVVAQADNTGLKKYDIDDCGLTRVTLGTLKQLLDQTHGASIYGPNYLTSAADLKAPLRVYMRQMKPGISEGEIESVLNTVVAFNDTSYIYRNPSTDTVILTTSAPPWNLPDLTAPGQNLPDGPSTTFKRNPVPFDLDRITNCGGECGFPHPWDCPLESQGSGQDTAKWTPSSGYRSILGVIRFRNAAFGGGHFCCPC